MAGKFEWTGSESARPIRQEDIQCNNCFHRAGRVDICAVYQEIKPTEVLDGEPCHYYRKEELT